MKKIFLAAVIVALLFAFASCSEDMFISNIYAEVETYEGPDLDNPEDLDAEDLLDVQDDDRFFDDVATLGEGEGGASNPAVQEIMETIGTAMDETLAAIEADPEADLLGNDEYQELALLQADIAMAASGADAVFDNFNGLIGDALGSVGTETDPEMPETIEEAINTLFEPDPDKPEAEQMEEVADMITGLLLTADALRFYGATLDETDDVDQTPRDESAEDLAVQALLAGVTNVFVDEVAGVEDPSPEETQAAVDAVVDAIFAEDPEAAIGDLLPPEATSEGGALYFSDFSEISNVAGNAGVGPVVDEGIDLSSLADIMDGGGDENE